MANTPVSEIFKDRRVQIGAAVAAVAVLALGTFAVLNNGSGGGDTAADAPPPAPANPGAPGATVPGGPAVTSPVAAGVPGSRKAPGVPTGTPGSKNAFALVPVQDSWAGAPTSFPGGGGSGGTGTTGAPGAPGAPGGAAPTGGAAPKLPKPIHYGQTAGLYRGDPFLSTLKFVVDLPPAYQFVVPLRLASRPKPVVPITDPIPVIERLGPLPRVPRRVAGILYDGAVSAILETGTPGPDADVRVVQAGSLVPSGDPTIGDLTVSVITTTQVTLRADDGRTVDVPLSTLPRAIADSLRQQAGQQAGQNGGIPGAPGVPGGPGDFGPRGPGGRLPGGGGALAPGGAVAN